MEFPYQLSLLIALSNEAKSFLVGSLLIILYCLLQWKKNANTKTKQPPQPSNSLPVIGHLHLLKGLPHVALGELADQYGPIFMIKLGIRRALVVSSADMAKQCLTGVNDSVFLNRPWKIHVEHLFYNSAMFGFSPYGQYWREMRKITTLEVLSNQRVERFKSVRISQTRLAINKIFVVGSEPIDMRIWFSDLSLNTLVRLVSGKSLEEWYQGEEYNQRKRLFTDFFELVGKFVLGDSLPALRWFDIGGYEKKMKEHAKEIDQVAQKWLAEHKKRRSSKEAQDDESWAFMDVLLEIFEKEQERPSKFDKDTIVKATCTFLILAGADTTSVTLTWTLSLLLNNKSVLKKSQAELDAVVGKERLVDESDLKNLVYLQSVLKESVRLYPAGPLSVPRESIVDCTVNGYNIPTGTQLFVNLYKMHRDPQVWKDPLIFNPERFLNSSKDYDFRGQNHEYMPFGSGRRICPGISFAKSTLEFTLANLLHGFDISISSGETVDMTEGFGLSNQKATPLEVILTHRLPLHLYNKTSMPVN